MLRFSHMHEKQRNFKSPAKKYQPKGLILLYEDRDILVVDKVSGLLTVSDDKGGDRTAYFLLNEYVRKGALKSRNRVFIVHRLDRDTSGVLVFAKTEQAKRILQDEWPDIKKIYYAITEGSLPEKEGLRSGFTSQTKAALWPTTKNTDRRKKAAKDSHSMQQPLHSSNRFQGKK